MIDPQAGEKATRALVLVESMMDGNPAFVDPADLALLDELCQAVGLNIRGVPLFALRHKLLVIANQNADKRGQVFGTKKDG